MEWNITEQTTDSEVSLMSTIHPHLLTLHFYNEIRLCGRTSSLGRRQSIILFTLVAQQAQATAPVHILHPSRSRWVDTEIPHLVDPANLDPHSIHLPARHALEDRLVSLLHTMALLAWHRPRSIAVCTRTFGAVKTLRRLESMRRQQLQYLYLL